VPEDINTDRRRFLRRAAMTIVGAHIGSLGTAAAAGQEPRELAALGRAVEWLNSPRLTPSSLAGKVVLVDFWTYTCINWLRTLPYVRAWSQKYAQGLVVIGVHTPEFPFERNVDYVRHAVQQMRIEYPIVIDNDYSIWRAFKNQYWQHCISSMREGAFASINSGRASTNGRSAPFNGCCRRRASPVPATGSCWSTAAASKPPLIGPT
jgi:thiol-disulfide isomerase/thioredoxin